jgi:hypothetical protein
MIGGDGTAIGIPIDNVRSLSEVWRPPDGEIAAPWTTGRVDRCCIPTPTKVAENVTASEFSKARKLLAMYLIGTKDRAEVQPILYMFPVAVTQELRLWMNSTTREKLTDVEQTALVKLLRSVISLACATHVLPESIIAHVRTVLNNTQRRHPTQVLCGAEDSKLWNRGMGPDIYACLSGQQAVGQLRDSFVMLLRLVCELRMCVVVWMCIFYILCDIGILCGCVRLWHFV